MMLISYIAPFIIVNSDRLISGNMIIKSKTNQTIWRTEFYNRESVHVKAEPSWPKSVMVIINAGGAETKKMITL